MLYISKSQVWFIVWHSFYLVLQSVFKNPQHCHCFIVLYVVQYSLHSEKTTGWLKKVSCCFWATL